jgi:hypothetical protein
VDLVRTDVSEEHIAFIFRVRRFWALLVRSEDAPHNGRRREPVATVSPLACLSVTVELLLMRMELVSCKLQYADECMLKSL